METIKTFLHQLDPESIMAFVAVGIATGVIITINELILKPLTHKNK